MKKLIYPLITVCIMFLSMTAFSQTPPPPNNGDSGNGGGTPVGGGAPIAGGLGILISMALAYAYTNLEKTKKLNDE